MFELEDIVQDDEQKQEFTINDDLKADWACRIIKQEKAEAERLSKVIDEEIEILKNKKEKLEQSYLNNTAWLRGKLADYFETVEKRELKTCFKYNLPSAELVFNKPKVKYERDNEKILNWLNANDKYDFIKVTHSVDWENLKKSDFFKQVDGITETMTEAKFEVK
jgi:hypothetical protein